MKSDIQIAQEAKMEPIVKIAEKLNLTEDDIELYGKYKCEMSLDVMDKYKVYIVCSEKDWHWDVKNGILWELCI